MAGKKVESERVKWIKRRHVLEGKKKELAAQLKAIEDEINDVDNIIVADLTNSDEERVEITGGIGIRLSRSTMPSVKDWDALYGYIHRHKAYYLLERRVGVTAFRELLEAGKNVPGVETFTKIKVNLVK